MAKQTHTNGKSDFVVNAFQTPNSYIDKVMPHLTGEEFKVLIYAVRRILGFQKRQDRISISQFTDGIKSQEGEELDGGTGLSIATVKKCLDNLVSFNLMVRAGENDPKTNEGVLWSLQWDSEKVNWKALEEREKKKAKVYRKKMTKARSMRHTPPNDIEPTPPNDIEGGGGNGIETQKTGESQGKTEQVSSLEEIEKSANKKVDAWLLLMNAPGLKNSVRIDAILSYLAGRLNINTETNRWKDFAKFVDDRQQRLGQNVETFINWLLSQKDFDIKFWSPQRMTEMYPQAFTMPGQSNAVDPYAPKRHKL